MEKKDNLRTYLKQLEELDSQINENSDPDEIMEEVNIIIGKINQDIKIETEDVLCATLKFINRSNNPDPIFAKEGDSGFDIRAFLKEDIIIYKGDITAIPTGLYVEVQKGLEVQIRSRSGLSHKSKLMVLNSPGTIDSGYRGEIIIMLANFGNSPYTVKNGDRIAQGVVCPVYGEGNLILTKVEDLSESSRGADGLGHSGIH